MSKSANIRIYSSTAFDGNVQAMLSDAFKWHKKMSYPFTPYTSSMRALDEHNIPREIGGIKIEPTRKNQNPSGSQLYIFVGTPTEVSFVPDSPTSLLVMGLGLPEVLSGLRDKEHKSETGFGDFILANYGRIRVIASEGELQEIKSLTPPPALPEAGIRHLETLDREYEGYGRSLHGSTLSIKNSKEAAKQIRKLRDSGQVTIRQIKFWCWQQGWEGSGVNQLVDFLK